MEFKDKRFIFLSVLFFIFLFLYWGRFGDPVIDCGREAYIPFAMADLGKVLFKDIICIYGPVPYYLNAVFVKLFGASLNTMYFIGAMLSYLFLFGFYNLSKRFLKKTLAFVITVAVLFVCILNPSISNFIFPYSYAIVYALLFAVFHLIFLFKFADNPSDKKNLCISALFLALCLLSKLDFIPCVLPFLLIIFKYREKLALKDFGKIILSFLTPFFMVFLILIFQKVSLQNLFFNFKMISNMAHSPSLEYFYTVCTGYFFDFKKTFMFTREFLCISLIFIAAGVFGYFASKIKNIFLYILCFFVIITVPVFLLFKFELVRYIFIYLPLLVLIFLVAKLRIFNDDTVAFSFILFSILFSLKTLFGLFHELYGTFYLPFILLSFIMALFILFKKHPAIVSHTCYTVCIIISFLFFIQNLVMFFGVKYHPIKSAVGVLYTEKQYSSDFGEVFKFLENNIQPGDCVLPLPEGLLVNFALKNDYKFFNTSFTPLDFDAYGEDYLADSLLAVKPKYIVMYRRSFKDYGKGFLCEDFGQKFCNVIKENYTDNVAPVGNGHAIKIFERKNND